MTLAFLNATPGTIFFKQFMEKQMVNEENILMKALYDMDFEGNVQKPNAMFYRVRMEQGVIVVPDKDSEEVLR